MRWGRSLLSATIGRARPQSSLRLKAAFLSCTYDQCSHWLALAGVASFFTQKSHAALVRGCNVMIQNHLFLPSDIFDSHRPLHSKTTSAHVGQPARAEVNRFLGKSWDSASISSQSRCPRLSRVALAFARNGARSIRCKCPRASPTLSITE